MTNIITADYNGTQVFFQDDAYLNATAIAAHFNKKPIEWLRLPSTEEYINTLCEKAKVGKSHFVRTTRGGSDLSLRGTWLHRRLAVPFARWLNVEFAIWCDEQIEQILINKNQPKQLALPEPQYKNHGTPAEPNSGEVYLREISQYDFHFLVRLFETADRQLSFIREIEPALEAIKSEFAQKSQGFTGDIIQLRNALYTLGRLLEHTQGVDKRSIDQRIQQERLDWLAVRPLR